MKTGVIVFLSAIALCGLAIGAEPQPDDQGLNSAVELIKTARQLSDIIYYQELYVPLERSVYLADDGTASFRPAYGYRKDMQVFTYGNGHDFVAKRAVPGRDDLSRAAAMYEEVLAKWTRGNRKDDRLLLPFELLRRPFEPVSGMPIGGNDARDALERGYMSLPSNLDAVCYLELALVYKELGAEEDYGKTLEKSISDLNLLFINFRYDVGFRHLVDRWTNFERPECCLLFLAAENARLDGRLNEAEGRYARLIEQAPGSPLAWEALVKISAMEGIEPEEMQRLTRILLDTYPLVWGQRILGNKLGEEEFAKQLPAILKEAGKEEVVREYPLDIPDP